MCNQTLDTLVLWSNGIGLDGAKELGPALRETKSLRILDLS